MSDVLPPPPPSMILPPRLVHGVAREPWRETLARARWALGAYWALLVSSWAVLLATSLRWWHGDEAVVWVLIAASAVGVSCGNALAIARVRPWVVQAAAHGGLALAVLGGLPSQGGEAIVGVVAFAWSLAGGHLTLQRRGALMTLWVPMICWTAAVVTVIQERGHLRAWEVGRKSSVWDPLTVSLLLLVFGEFVLFLAGQEHYHTQVWQSGAAASPMHLTQHRDLGATRITKRGVFTVLALVALTTGLGARIAPWLWRTERAEGSRNTPAPAQPAPDVPEPDWDALLRSIQRAAREAARQAREVLPFVPLFLLDRPLRRAIRLRHYRRPLHAVSPTERASNLWRYVLIALGDAQLAPLRGEPIEHAVERAVELRTARHEPLPEGLAEAAEIYQRVRFGLGIPAGALDALQQHAERAYVTVRAPMTRAARVASWWRRLDA